MNKKTTKLLTGFAIFMLVATLSLMMFSQTKAYAESPTTPGPDQNEPFTPTVLKPAWVDQDNNGIADTLDQEIAERIANDTAQEYVNVTVMLKSVPTIEDADDFVSAGGYVTTDAWTQALYGFGGMITYNEIVTFVQRCPDVLLVEKEAVGEAQLAYAAQQVGARTYVWNTLGLQGDPNTALAIADTGIDGSHVDFAPGYGNLDFSKKIVGWRDQVGSTTSPVDDNGHGSHCAGLSAGNGFFNVDAAGNAITTYSANLGSVTTAGTYIISGMMVNKTGPITINVRWARSGSGVSLTNFSLWYGDKTLSTASWTQVASVLTPSQNTFYSLTYNVPSVPSGGYDMYHIRTTLTTGTGSLYINYNMTWPYMPPSDGFSAWTGIAPQSRLVGVKILNNAGSGTTTQITNGINWLISNRQAYHITVASMSVGFSSEVTSVDAAMVNLVNSGVTCVVSAGNSGSGSNYIYTPGSVDEIMTVAAMNQFDNTASYSSQGGTSRYSGRTTKPDITAPGGSFYAVPLYSADSNYNDAEGRWSEMLVDDSAPMQGTSMSCPVIAGCAQVVVQALGGYANWQWTRAQALQPKMILLMTATETYPNLREGGTTSTSPTLNRGGKDVHEGYGRVNLDAAVDAVLRSYGIGTTETVALGMPPTLADISVLGQRLAWATNVQLVQGFRYTFTLNVPAGADYDLYLYNSTGTTYGEPAIVASSTTPATGGTEQITITSAPYTGTYYLVVKRATETTGSGTFTLTSSGPVYVTLNTPGLPSASNVVHYTRNSVSQTGSIASSTFSGYADTGTTLSIDNPIPVSSTERYNTTDTTSFTITSSATFTVNYAHQYYLTVTSPHDAPTPSSGWFSAGTNITASVTSPVSGPTDTRYVCTGWTGTGSVSASGTATSVTYTINAASSITWNWKIQYYITVASLHDTPTASAWIDSGTDFTASVASPTEVVADDHQWICTGYKLDGGSLTSGTSYTFTSVAAAHTIEFDWNEQFWIVFDQSGVGSDFSGTVMTVGGVGYNRGGHSNWYDSGASVAYSYASPLSVNAGKRYFKTSTDASPLTVSAATTATGSYKTQYLLTVSTTPANLNPQPTITLVSGYDAGNGWYDASSVVSIDSGSPAGYTFDHWSGDSSGSTVPLSATMNSAKTVVAVYKFNLVVESGFKAGDSPSFASSPYLTDIACVLVKATSGYKLAGTSPGTCDFAIAVKNTGTTTFASVMINVNGRNDFCFQSSNPIRVLDANGVDISAQFTMSGTWPAITISSKTIFSGLPASASLYITIHLDYALTGQIFSSSTYNKAYTFTATITGTSGANEGNTDAYGSVVLLSKKVTIIYGFVTTLSGMPLEGAKIELYKDAQLLYTLYTDADGFYCFIDGCDGITLTDGVTYTVKCTPLSGDGPYTKTVTAKKLNAVAVNFQVRYTAI